MLNKKFPVKSYIFRTSVLSGVLFAGVILIAPFSASAQQDVSNRLNRLENEVQTLSRALFKGEAVSESRETYSAPSMSNSSAQAAMELRLSQLEIEVKNLTGKIEQQAYESALRDRELLTTISLLEQKLAEASLHAMPAQTSQTQEGTIELRSDKDEKEVLEVLETVDVKQGLNTNLNSPKPSFEIVDSVPQSNMLYSEDLIEKDTMREPPTSSVELSQGTLGTLVKPKDQEGSSFASLNTNTPTDLYDKAFTMLREKNYSEAESSFKMFIARHPSHKLAANAKYWLGETYYVRNQYEQAARIFAESYKDYPNGTKGPDSLLKLAMSLSGMGKKEEACIAFAQIKQEFSSGAGPIYTRAQQEMEALSCS
jgi:tol-pal system protein YbgF